MSTETKVTVAYILDRADQYANDSCCKCALEELAMKIADDEHLDAWAHNELEEWMKAPIVTKIDAVDDPCETCAKFQDVGGYICTWHLRKIEKKDSCPDWLPKEKK